MYFFCSVIILSLHFHCWLYFLLLYDFTFKPKYTVDLSSALCFWRNLGWYSATSIILLPPLQYTISELWCLFGGKREDYQNCSVLYCVLKLCTVISTLRWAVLTVLWIGFCDNGPISLCIHLFVFISVYFVCFCCFIMHSCCIIVSTVGWIWWDWSLILRTCLPSVLWHCWLSHLTRKNPSPVWPTMCLVGR